MQKNLFDDVCRCTHKMSDFQAAQNEKRFKSEGVLFISQAPHGQ